MMMMVDDDDDWRPPSHVFCLKDLAKRGQRTVRRALMGEMLDVHESQEMARESVLGSEFFGLDREQSLDKLMETLDKVSNHHWVGGVDSCQVFVRKCGHKWLSKPNQ